MLGRDLLAHVGVVEAELVAAVVADGHGRGAKTHHLDLVRVAGLGDVRVVTTMDRDEGGSHDRVWAVRTHESAIGSTSPGDKRLG